MPPADIYYFTLINLIVLKLSNMIISCLKVLRLYNGYSNRIVILTNEQWKANELIILAMSAKFIWRAVYKKTENNQNIKTRIKINKIIHRFKIPFTEEWSWQLKHAHSRFQALSKTYSLLSDRSNHFRSWKHPMIIIIDVPNFCVIWSYF